MRFLCVFIGCLLINVSAKCQDLGLSFSYFIPKNGAFSVPVTPFSLRGVGVDLTDNIAIETGFTFYRMSGMNVKDLPFESKKPLIGPFFSLFVPLEGVFTLYFDNQAFKLKGGGFAFYNLGTQVHSGNMDRALRDYLGWQLVNSDIDVKNNLGIGYHFGAEYIIYITDKFGISFEAYYLTGSAPLDMKGSYSGIPQNGDDISTLEVEYPDARLDFSGYEFSIGLLFSP